jgi:hypothetical protein
VTPLVRAFEQLVVAQNKQSPKHTPKPTSLSNIAAKRPALERELLYGVEPPVFTCERGLLVAVFGEWTLKNPLNAPDKNQTAVLATRLRWSSWARGMTGEPERIAAGFVDGAAVRHLAVAADDVASAVSGAAPAWRGSGVGVRAGGGLGGRPGQRTAGFIVDTDGDRCVA